MCVVFSRLHYRSRSHETYPGFARNCKSCEFVKSRKLVLDHPASRAFLNSTREKGLCTSRVKSILSMRNPERVSNPDFVSRLHNCLEFSQPLSCLYQAIRLCKHGKRFLLLNFVYIYNNYSTSARWISDVSIYQISGSNFRAF